MTVIQHGKQHLSLIHGHQPVDVTFGAILTALALLGILVGINSLFSRPISWTTEAPATLIVPEPASAMPATLSVPAETTPVPAGAD